MIIKADNEKAESSGFLIILKYCSIHLLHLLFCRCCNKHPDLCSYMCLFKRPLSLTWMCIYAPVEVWQKTVSLVFSCILLSWLILLYWKCCLVPTQVLSVLPETFGICTGSLWTWEQCGTLTRTVNCCSNFRLIFFHIE